MPVTAQVAGIAMLAAAAVPLLISDTTTRWNFFAVMDPFWTALTAVLLWLVGAALRRRTLPLPYASGVLLSLGALTGAGALGVIGYTAEWVGGPTALLGVVALVGAAAATAVGVSCGRSASGGSEDAVVERSSVLLAVVGTVLVGAALFVPYDGPSSLWDEVIEGSSAAFAYVPVTAVLLLVVADLLLASRRRLASGMLTAVGVVTAVHFVGVLLAASFAVGEAGEVRAAWAVGVAGGVLAAMSGVREVPPTGRPAARSTQSEPT
jgi:hypothetical protein